MKKTLFALFVILAACGSEEIVQQDTPPLYKYSELKSAVAEAKVTAPIFWENFADPAPGEERFRVKITRESDAYKIDYVWVEYLQENGAPGEWRGAVSLENGGNNRFKTGDTLEFSEGDVADWAYHENGKIRGGFTTRAMLTIPKDADTSAIEDLYHENPVPD